MKTWQIKDPHGNQIECAGPPLDSGTLPAFFYFALSAEESLHLHPYNSPVVHLEGATLRVFSFTLPAHGEGFDKFHAMEAWADWMKAGSAWLETFFDEATFSMQWLIEIGAVDKDAIALGGLSRGGFIATHLASRMPHVRALLGFAPLTRLCDLKECTSFHNDPILKDRIDRFDLETRIENLLHVHHLRFYIGNRDLRVNTDACYHFIRHLAETTHEKRTHSQIEMRITPSLGHKGHGTAPHIFEEGALWIKQLLLMR